jgi:pilus assembly protein CpaB
MEIPRVFSFRRKLPTSSKVFLLIAAACAIASFLLVRGDAARAGSQGALTGPSVQIVVAAHQVDAGTTLVADDVRIRAIPAPYAPPGSLPSVDAAIGLVTGTALVEGEPLSMARLGRSLLAGAVGPGRLVVSATFGSIPDGLTTADRVDAFATFGGARPYTELVGEDLRVLEIEPSTSTFGGDTATIVTLDVDPATARQLLQADASGTLALVARGADPSATPSPSASPWAAPTPG